MVEVKGLMRIPMMVTLPKECVEWLDRKVESRIYASRSHVIEVLVLEGVKAEKKEELPKRRPEKLNMELLRSGNLSA